MNNSNWLFWIGLGFITSVLIGNYLTDPVFGKLSGIVVFTLYLILGGMDYLMSRLNRQ